MTKNDPAVTTHVNMMQGIIKRMASNSASCKQWCILIITALLTFSKGNTDPIDLSGICLIPLILFCFMDCFYLGLERQMKNKLKTFVVRLNRHENVEAVIFTTGLEKDSNLGFCERIEKWIGHQLIQLWNTILAFTSFSIFPFYICLYLLIQYLK